MQKLAQRQWSTDILSVQNGHVMISGGTREGLQIGDRLSVARRGKLIVSRQTGLPIELPAQPLATIQVQGFFGSEDAEGARAIVIAGKIEGNIEELTVTSPTS